MLEGVDDAGAEQGRAAEPDQPTEAENVDSALKQSSSEGVYLVEHLCLRKVRDERAERIKYLRGRRDLRRLSGRFFRRGKRLVGECVVA